MSTDVVLAGKPDTEVKASAVVQGALSSLARHWHLSQCKMRCCVTQMWQVMLSTSRYSTSADLGNSSRWAAISNNIEGHKKYLWSPSVLFTLVSINCVSLMEIFIHLSTWILVTDDPSKFIIQVWENGKLKDQFYFLNCVPQKNSCWRHNHQYIKMCCYSEIGPFKRYLI